MNCKPGDLAYLSSDCVAEGVIVEVIKAIPPLNGSPAWHCRSRTPVLAEHLSDGHIARMTELAIEDKYLRPISGVPVHDEEHDEVTA